jgi:hypothetical protein
MPMPELTLEELRTHGFQGALNAIIATRGLTPIQASFLRNVPRAHVETPLANFFDPSIPVPPDDTLQLLRDQAVVATAYADAVGIVLDLVSAKK